MRFLLMPLLFLPCFDAAAYHPLEADLAEPLTRIAFGSCNRHDSPQPVWAPVLDLDPDLWIWLGDNIYGDTEDMDLLRAKYEAQFAQPDYKRLREETPVVGTWDDHDYGANNAGSSFPQREASKTAALKFLETPKDSPRWQHEGIYDSYLFGPIGRRVHVILLDVRYNMQQPGPGSDNLGETQWTWLQEQLQQPAELTIICSGIQILPVDHRFEKWANFPKSRERLLGMISEARLPAVVLLSGDRHIHEFSLLRDETTGQYIPEVTTSGMTHSYDKFKGEPNRYRMGPWYSGLGFGVIEIDWDADLPKVSLQVRDTKGKERLRQDFPLQNLRHSNE